MACGGDCGCGPCGGMGALPPLPWQRSSGVGDLFERNADGEIVMSGLRLEEWGTLATLVIGVVTLYTLWGKGRR